MTQWGRRRRGLRQDAGSSVKQDEPLFKLIQVLVLHGLHTKQLWGKLLLCHYTDHIYPHFTLLKANVLFKFTEYNRSFLLSVLPAEVICYYKYTSCAYKLYRYYLMSTSSS